MNNKKKALTCKFSTYENLLSYLEFGLAIDVEKQGFFWEGCTISIEVCPLPMEKPFILVCKGYKKDFEGVDSNE